MPSRQRVYRTEAVVLRRLDFGEADRLLTVLTPESGKLKLVAKGVRRTRSKKAGHLEPFTRVHLMLARGRELDIITQAEAVDLYPALRDDLERLGYASYVAELADRFLVEGEENRPAYKLLVVTLEMLVSGIGTSAVLRCFELKLLELMGYKPELFRCVGCGAEIRPEDQYFSSSEGGVLCPDCGTGRRGIKPISLAALKVLRYYQRTPLDTVVATEVRASVHEEIEAVMETYLAYLLERRLNTPHFLREVRRIETTRES